MHLGFAPFGCILAPVTVFAQPVASVCIEIVVSVFGAEEDTASEMYSRACPSVQRPGTPVSGLTLTVF